MATGRNLGLRVFRSGIRGVGKPELGGSGVVMNGLMSRVTRLLAYNPYLGTYQPPLITTHLYLQETQEPDTLSFARQPRASDLEPQSAPQTASNSLFRSS